MHTSPTQLVLCACVCVQSHAAALSCASFYDMSTFLALFSSNSVTVDEDWWSYSNLFYCDYGLGGKTWLCSSYFLLSCLVQNIGNNQHCSSVIGPSIFIYIQMFVLEVMVSIQSVRISE